MTTAVVKVKDQRGNFVPARALLDSCSTVNLITEKFAKLLNLPKQKCSVNIGAVGGLYTVSKFQIQAIFQSNYNSCSYKLQFLIVPQIADAVPNDVFPRERFDIPRYLPLADPQFHLPKSVDLLFASNVTLSVLAIGQIKLQHRDSEIVLQKTRLGWIVAGGAETFTPHRKGVCNVVDSEHVFERLWIMEDADHAPARTREDVHCEEHYVATTTRDPDTDRYTVCVPFKGNKCALGNSRRQALNRYYSLQRKLEADPWLKVEYTKAIEKLISDGHISFCDDDTDEGYYIPHLPVIRKSSETTKVRPVCDASAKTSSGLSLNDVQMAGPTIQKTIFEQILRFRTHVFVVTADIEKMYLQILIHPEDRKFHKILWPNKQGNLATLNWNVVTFGTKSAPFLAIRTLHQLAQDEAENYPRASKILLRDFYVDDLLTGADTGDDILAIRDDMIALLKLGGFNIRKWASNHQSVLNDIDKSVFDLDSVVKDDPVQKTLGIVWDSQNDTLTYIVNEVDPQSSSTKRKLLSEISKIFDPLGLLGPVILWAKVLIQDCWKAKITWDEKLPQCIHTKWITFANQLPILTNFSIPRRILISNPVKIELHGFCDACMYGYGACLFLKSTDALGHFSIKLICSKYKVAPLKSVTIPRLELSAALVLTNLYVTSKSQFDFQIDKKHFWSDSSIVLCWLRKDPHLLKLFEANRVGPIQILTDDVSWKHVRSEDNPADALSRGQLPSEFITNSFWTCGPSWLASDESEWPNSNVPSLVDLPGLKKATCLATSSSSSFEEIFSRFSSYDRFIRIIAFVWRWKKGPRIEGKPHQLFTDVKDDAYRITKIIRKIRPLEPLETVDSETRILLRVQQEAFSLERRILSQSSGRLAKGIDFYKLQPFIGNGDLLRVGGRLKKSELPYDQKHPVLLPQNHHVTTLIIRHFHESNHHAGISATLYNIRVRFFVLNGKNQVRRFVRRCVSCIRRMPTTGHAPMADLPGVRVSESPAFCHTGVDFFGPLNIKEKAHKNKSFIKTWGCVFICMASKAVHIELAIDLSSVGFLSAFRRFIARRGVPAHVYSDNGTNFVGATKELQEIYDKFNSEDFKREIGEYAIAKRIDWHFNPPLSPHFGGIWEAAVKSFKHHLKRIVDKQLTYEQINTFLIEIEAILNSRPLCTLSADPNDPISITPAHLLIGRPLNVLPEESLLSVPDNRLSTYKFLTKARQNFWEKWHKEYLHELQIRKNGTQQLLC